jgi:hypothetical protein
MSLLGTIKPLASDDQLISSLLNFATRSFNKNQFLLNEYFAGHSLYKLTFDRYGKLNELDLLVMRFIIAYLLFIQILCHDILDNAFEHFKFPKNNMTRYAVKVMTSAITLLFCNMSNNMLKSNTSNQVHLPIELRIFPSKPRIIDLEYPNQNRPKDLNDAQYYYYDVINVQDMKEMFKKESEKELQDEMLAVVELFMQKFQQKYKEYDDNVQNVKNLTKKKLEDCIIRKGFKL